VTCDPFDVVVVPFPFVDSDLTKRRPALVLSIRDFNKQGQSILAMITSAEHTRWPTDVTIDWKQAGLPRPSIVRMRLFTLDNRLIERRAGRLNTADRRSAAAQFHRVIVPRPE
jgi:mRNA interferase MazF